MSREAETKDKDGMSPYLMFLDGFPIPSSMPLKEPAALCPQGIPASWQPTHLHPTHLFLKLVLTGFCCLQSKESLPRPLRTLIQIKEFLCPSPCFPQGDSAAFTHCLPSKLNFSMNKHKSLYLTMLTPIGRDENKTWSSFSDSQTLLQTTVSNWVTTASGLIALIQCQEEC